MASKCLYSKLIRNDYLNLSKEIKGKTQWELEVRCKEQIQKWKVLEAKEREKERIEDLKAKAEIMNLQSQKDIEKHKNILLRGIRDIVLDWDTYKNKDTYVEFSFDFKYPDIQDIKTQLGVPKKSILEYFIKPMARRRIDLENQAINKYNNDIKEFEKEQDHVFKKWKKGKENFEENQRKHNESIILWKSDFEAGKVKAVERYMKEILTNSNYQEMFSLEYSLQYDEDSRILIISLILPNVDQISKIKGYKYIASTKSIKELVMKEKEFQGYYDEIIKQITLRTIYEVYTADYEKNIESIVLNGWVNGINRATGKDFTSFDISNDIKRGI